MFCLFSWEKSTKYSPNTGLENQFSATLRGQPNWTGPIAKRVVKSSQNGHFSKMELSVCETTLDQNGPCWSILAFKEVHLRSMLEIPKTHRVCENFWPGPSAEMCQGVSSFKIWRIFPGIFLEDLSGHFFPTKMRRKNPATKSAKKSGGPTIKIRDKTVLPKSDPKNFFEKFARTFLCFPVT